MQFEYFIASSLSFLPFFVPSVHPRHSAAIQWHSENAAHFCCIINSYDVCDREQFFFALAIDFVHTIANMVNYRKIDSIGKLFFLFLLCVLSCLSIVAIIMYRLDKFIYGKSISIISFRWKFE